MDELLGGWYAGTHSSFTRRSLVDWLDDGSGRVKFVVSSVPFFPDYRKPNEDKWSGFPSRRLQILDFIRARKIKRVVFLSGDIHPTLLYMTNKECHLDRTQ